VNFLVAGARFSGGLLIAIGRAVVSEAKWVARPAGSRELCSFCAIRLAQHWGRSTIFGSANLCSECLLGYGEQLELAIGAVADGEDEKQGRHERRG